MNKIIKFLKKVFSKKPQFDRNYHHYVLTDHCRSRMKERRILYQDINLCFKYGRLVDNQIILDISHIPDEHFKDLTNKQVKHILGHLPLVINLKPGTNIITTVFKGNNSIRSNYDINMLKEIYKTIGG